MSISKVKTYKSKGPQGKRVTGQVDGKTVSFRLRKTIPKGCKTPKQLCIVCFSHIHKNDLNYEKKICKQCD